MITTTCRTSNNTIELMNVLFIQTHTVDHINRLINDVISPTDYSGMQAPEISDSLAGHAHAEISPFQMN